MHSSRMWHDAPRRELYAPENTKSPIGRTHHDAERRATLVAGHSFRRTECADYISNGITEFH